MAIKSFKRYEKKFILTESQYNLLIPKLLKYMTPDKHCTLDKDYCIYNVYYDTKNNDVIRHSISKPCYKEKLRLRSYKIPSSLNDTVFLELKKKINGIVNKRRVSLTLNQANEFVELGKKPSTNDYISNQVINEIEYYLSKNQVFPNVYICYTRKAFFAKDNPNFRLTFDYNILTRRDHVHLDSIPSGVDVLGKNKYLMEVKILGSIPLWFTKILSELSIYNTHFSKYGQEFTNYCLDDNKISDIQRRENIC